MENDKKPLKPLLRWAGGKSWLVQRLRSLLPPNIGTYYEPFLGGGSFFFNLLPENAVLSDLNERLVETYEVLRDHPDELTSILGNWSNSETTFYFIRNRDFPNKVYRAAQFIYLNRTCWNGLYRVSRAGNFNVPFGYHGRQVFDPGHLHEISGALQNSRLISGDFARSVSEAREGDVIYFDPPYTTRHSKNGFLQYNKNLFSWEDQERLGKVAVVLAERGCHVVVTNASYRPILTLYPGFRHEIVPRSSVLAAKPEYRQRVTEFLLYSSSIPDRADINPEGKQV